MIMSVAGVLKALAVTASVLKAKGESELIIKTASDAIRAFGVKAGELVKKLVRYPYPDKFGSTVVEQYIDKETGERV